MAVSTVLSTPLSVTVASDSPAAVSPAVTRMRDDWELCRALIGGTRTMREKGELYLPKWPNEEDADYAKRLGASTLFPGFSRTIVTLTGKPFSKPITYDDDVPEQIREMLDDADLQGRNLDAFASDVFQNALGCGLCGILVDFPTGEQPVASPTGLRSVKEEREAGMRPYLVHVREDQLLGWRAERVKSEFVLTQLRFIETVEEKDGAFGVKEVQQVRVLEPTGWQTFRRKDNVGDWQPHKRGVNTLGKIPFAPIYGERQSFMQGRSPLIELAHLNIKHWQQQSDQDSLMHVARVPILVAVGVDPTDPSFKLVLGASAAVRLPTQGQDLKFVEHSGAAIGAGKQQLDDLRSEMELAGAELLVMRPTPTATEVAKNDSIGMCALQRMAVSFEDALALVLSYWAEWMKLGDDGGHVHLFKDFGAATLAEATAALIKDMNLAGKLSDESAFEELQRRGIYGAERKFEDEQERLAAQGPPPGQEGGDQFGGDEQQDQFGGQQPGGNGQGGAFSFAGSDVWDLPQSYMGQQLGVGGGFTLDDSHEQDIVDRYSA